MEADYINVNLYKKAIYFFRIMTNSNLIFNKNFSELQSYYNKMFLLQNDFFFKLQLIFSKVRECI